MRAIWSFWSKPHRAERSTMWTTPDHHWMSWILSVETARRHLPETALHTDSAGAELLVDRLGLEFGEVYTTLDALADEDPGWWALGKLHTYTLQTEPFVHIDSDVYLWKPLPDLLLRAPVLAQHPEETDVYYAPQCLEETFSRHPGSRLPREWTWFPEQQGVHFAPCCGILGGCDVDFLRGYAEKALSFLRHPDNRSAFAAFQDKPGNMILLEQYFLGACLSYCRKHIEYLFDSWTEATNPVHAAHRGYTHLIGSAKKDEWIARRLEARVRREYPVLFERIPGLRDQ
jgi:hypothetical protein